MRDARPISAREVSQGVQRRVLDLATWFGSTVVARSGDAPLVFERLPPASADGLGRQPVGDRGEGDGAVENVGPACPASCPPPGSSGFETGTGQRPGEARAGSAGQRSRGSIGMWSPPVPIPASASTTAIGKATGSSSGGTIPRLSTSSTSASSRLTSRPGPASTSPKAPAAPFQALRGWWSALVPTLPARSYPMQVADGRDHECGASHRATRHHLTCGRRPTPPTPPRGEPAEEEARLADPPHPAPPGNC